MDCQVRALKADHDKKIKEIAILCATAAHAMAEVNRPKDPTELGGNLIPKELIEQLKRASYG